MCPATRNPDWRRFLACDVMGLTGAWFNSNVFESYAQFVQGLTFWMTPRNTWFPSVFYDSPRNCPRCKETGIPCLRPSEEEAAKRANVQKEQLGLYVKNWRKADERDAALVSEKTEVGRLPTMMVTVWQRSLGLSQHLRHKPMEGLKFISHPVFKKVKLKRTTVTKINKLTSTLNNHFQTTMIHILKIPRRKLTELQVRGGHVPFGEVISQMFCGGPLASCCRVLGDTRRWRVEFAPTRRSVKLTGSDWFGGYMFTEKNDLIFQMSLGST